MRSVGRRCCRWRPGGLSGVREVGLRAATAVQVRLPAPLDAGRRPLALRHGIARWLFSVNQHSWFSNFPHGAGTRSTKRWGGGAPLPNRSSWRHILKKVDPGHIGSFRSGCRRRPRCCAPTARRVVGGSLETHRVTPRVRGGSRRRRRHRGAGQSRRRARIVLSLLHAAGGALRMLVRECRPAAQRPLQCRRGSVRPRRAPHRGTLGTWRRGTRLAALRAGPFRRRARSRSWCVLGASTASAGVTMSAPPALDVFGGRGAAAAPDPAPAMHPGQLLGKPRAPRRQGAFRRHKFSSCLSRQP